MHLDRGHSAAPSPQHWLLHRRMTVPWAVALLLVLTVLGARTWSVLNVPGAPNVDQWGMQDFRDAIYYPVVALLEGENPYDTPTYLEKYPVRQHFPLYSPLTLLLHLPFGLLPYELSQLTYYLVNVVLYVVLARVSLRFCHLQETWPRILALTTLILASRPGHQGLVVGQCTPQIVLLCWLALEWSKRRPWPAAIALALATSKPTFGVPIFLLMLARGDYRTCVYAVLFGGLATLAVTGLLAHNSGGIDALVASIPENANAFDRDPGASAVKGYARIDPYALLSRLLGQALPQSLEVLLFVGVCGVAAVAIAAVARRLSDRDATGLTATLAIFATLLAIYHQTYDTLLCILPLVAILSGEHHAVWQRVPRWQRRCIVAAIAIPAVNYLATGSVIDGLHLTGWTWQVVTAINSLALLLGGVVTLAAAAHVRRTAALPNGQSGQRKGGEA